MFGRSIKTKLTIAPITKKNFKFKSCHKKNKLRLTKKNQVKYSHNYENILNSSFCKSFKLFSLLQ